MPTHTALPRLRVAHLLGMTLLYFCSVGFLMQFPRLVLRMGGSAYDVGWLLALGIIPALLLARPVAEWNHRIGGRWPMVAGAAVAALSNIAMVAVEQVGFGMYALRLLFAVGHTLVFSTLFAQAAYLVDDAAQRAKLIGWLAVMTQLGNAVGSTLGEISYGYGAMPFWLGCAGFGFATGALGFAWTLAPKAGPAPVAGAVEEKHRWPPEVWATIGVAMTFAGVTQFLPAFVDHQVASGAIEKAFASSWFITTALLIVALVRLVGGWFARSLLRPQVLGACHVVLIATLLCVPWMHTVQQAVVLGIGFGISYGWLYPALSALAFNRMPAHARARVTGWLVIAFEFGFRISPIALGALIDIAGYPAMFISLGLAYLLILAVAWGAGKRNIQLAAAGV